MSERETRTLREWWAELDNDRQAILNRKREHSMLTIPSLLPWEGRVSTSPLDVPYSSVAADGINALASRIMAVVLPLNGQPIFDVGNTTPFDPEGLDDTEMQDSLARFARYSMTRLAPTNLRSQLNLFYKHLIAIGDALMVLDDHLNARLFRADQYVVRRMHEGDWVDIIVKEAVLPEFHPELRDIDRAKVQDDITSGIQEDWEVLYTHVHKDPESGEVTETQEFRDGPVGKPVTQPVSRWLPARWEGIIGEAYGVSLIESNFGDVRGSDALGKALLDSALLNAEYRWGVNPAGITELQDVLDSVNGDFVPAAPGDVFPLQFQNSAQLSFTLQAVEYREQQLQRKFLKRNTRDAERVTRAEILMDAQELESQLGGILSMAGREVQDPIARWTIHRMGEQGLIPKEISEELNKEGGLVQLRIRAGLEVLQLEAEREKLDGMIDRMRNLPEKALRVFKWGPIARDWWQSNGLDSAGRVMTDEEVAAMDAQEAQAAAAQQAAVASAQAAAQGAAPPPQQ